MIFLAGGYETVKLVGVGEGVDWSALLIGVLASGVSAYLCIHYFLKLLDRIGFMPFVYYRVVLGVLLLVLFW